MTNKKNKNNVYDLEERTAKFGEQIIRLVKLVPKDLVSNVLTSQLVRSATSVGANYCEADNAESKRDFQHKISLCKKEAKESKHWLRMLAVAVPSDKDQIRTLWLEAKELTFIFNAIYNSSKSSK